MKKGICIIVCALTIALSIGGCFAMYSTNATGVNVAISAQMSTVTYTFNVPSWVSNNGAELYAWIWDNGGGFAAHWEALTKVNATTYTMTVNAVYNYSGCNIKRCDPSATPELTESNKTTNTLFDNSKWNESGNVNFSSGTYSYNAF